MYVVGLGVDGKFILSLANRQFYRVDRMSFICIYLLLHIHTHSFHGGRKYKRDTAMYVVRAQSGKLAWHKVENAKKVLVRRARDQRK